MVDHRAAEDETWWSCCRPRRRDLRGHDLVAHVEIRNTILGALPFVRDDVIMGLSSGALMNVGREHLVDHALLHHVLDGGVFEERPVVRDGQVVVRPMMYLALSYDHRLVDGREAVTFLVRVKEAIEDPTRLLIDL